MIVTRDVTSISTVDLLTTSVAARVALGTFLLVIHKFPLYLKRSWHAVWYSLGILRDCTLLPVEVVNESDMDLLPPIIRADFEGRLKAIHEVSSSSKNTHITKEKKSLSLLSLQGLGEAFFGSSSNIAGVESKMMDGPCRKGISNSMSSRWDAGYEDIFTSANSEGTSEINELKGISNSLLDFDMSVLSTSPSSLRCDCFII